MLNILQSEEARNVHYGPCLACNVTYGDPSPFSVHHKNDNCASYKGNFIRGTEEQLATSFG